MLNRDLASICTLFMELQNQFFRSLLLLYSAKPAFHRNIIMKSLHIIAFTLTFTVSRWAQANRERLQSQNSSLEFKLHRLRFIDLVQEGPDRQAEALLYARNFAPFAASHAKGTLFS